MKRLQGILYLFGAFALAGTSVITGHALAGKLGSFTITAISLLTVLVGLLPFAIKRVVRTVCTLTGRDWRLLTLQAFFGIFLFRVLMLIGIRQTSTVEAGILTGTTPAITALLAIFFLKERLRVTTAIGIGCTVIGMVLLQGNSLLTLQFSTLHLWGNALMLCAAASEATFNVLSRAHMVKVRRAAAPPMHPMVQMLLVSAIALAMSLLPALGEQPLAAIPSLNAAEWFALCWYGLVVTALAFILFYAGVKRCGANTTAAFSGMMPLTSMLLSLILLKESIAITQWLGGLLIVCSMLLISTREHTAQPASD